MIKKPESKLPWFVAVLVLILLVGGLYFAYLSREVPSLENYQTWQGGLFGAIPLLAFLLTGLLITVRIPGNRYGWVLTTFAALWVLRGFVENLGIYQYYIGEGGQGYIFLTSGLAAICWSASVAMLPFILLFFPTGNYLSPRWRIVGWVILVCLGVGNVAGMFAPGKTYSVAAIENPLGLAGLPGELANILLFISFVIIFGCILLGAISIVIRFIHSKGVERQQLKWITSAAVLFSLFLFADVYTELPGLWESVKEALIFTTFPVALGIAIFRYRLYEIDVIIRKTLVYSIITVLSALVYLGGVALLESVVSAVSTQRSTISIVLSTLGIAALFTPLRRRVQDFIDRRFYRKKYDAERILATFAATARDEVDIERLQEALIRAVYETVQPELVGYWTATSRATPPPARRLSSGLDKARE
jgi:hypothetical protein